MRRSAYIKALEDAAALVPQEIPEYRRYFNQLYNPQLEVIAHIKKTARFDMNLHDCELVDILNWRPSSASNRETSSSQQGQAEGEGVTQ